MVSSTPGRGDDELLENREMSNSGQDQALHVEYMNLLPLEIPSFPTPLAMRAASTSHLDYDAVISETAFDPCNSPWSFGGPAYLSQHWDGEHSSRI
jgi:hypothetical protein